MLAVLPKGGQSLEGQSLDGGKSSGSDEGHDSRKHPGIKQEHQRTRRGERSLSGDHDEDSAIDGRILQSAGAEQTHHRQQPDGHGADRSIDGHRADHDRCSKAQT